MVTGPSSSAAPTFSGSSSTSCPDPTRSASSSSTSPLAKDCRQTSPTFRLRVASDRFVEVSHGTIDSASQLILPSHPGAREALPEKVFFPSTR